MTQPTKISDLIAERRGNLEATVPVRNIHKTAGLCYLPPGGVGKVSPMDLHANRAWLRRVTIDDEIEKPAKAKKGGSE